jgi:hypothetical protein
MPQKKDTPVNRLSNVSQRWQVVAALVGRLVLRGIAVTLLLPLQVAANGNVTATQFAVTEGGAATISIPIQVPRGIGGMEPQLSLNYASGAGNGVLGVGWSLQGPSAITRCPQTMAIDGVRGNVNFTSSDRFCLDGQRLLMIDPSNPNSPTPPIQTNYGSNGVEYRTERDSFSRIKSFGQYSNFANTPLGFKVETKSGLIMEFGDTSGTVSSSQVLTKFSTLPATRENTINRWMLRRISDRHGSFVEFVYCQGMLNTLSSTCLSPFSGSAPIHFIRYTNRGDALNGTFAVMFQYTSRPDVVETFAAGSSTQQTQRMTAIQTFINFSSPGAPGTLVRSYDIQYEPLDNGSGTSLRATNTSRISKIQEKGLSGGVPALPPVSFIMENDGVLGQTTRHSSSQIPGAPPPRNCGGFTAARILGLCP